MTLLPISHSDYLVTIPHHNYLGAIMESSAIQAITGIVAGIVGIECDAYSSATTADIVIIPNGAVWVSQTVSLAYVQLDGMGTHGIPTEVTLHTSIGMTSTADSDPLDPYARVARRILDAVHAVLLYA